MALELRALPQPRIHRRSHLLGRGTGSGGDAEVLDDAVDDATRMAQPLKDLTILQVSLPPRRSTKGHRMRVKGP